MGSSITSLHLWMKVNVFIERKKLNCYLYCQSTFPGLLQWLFYVVKLNCYLIYISNSNDIDHNRKLNIIMFTSCCEDTFLMAISNIFRLERFENKVIYGWNVDFMDNKANFFIYSYELVHSTYLFHRCNVTVMLRI